jgi:hypothetical protein
MTFGYSSGCPFGQRIGAISVMLPSGFVRNRTIQLLEHQI